MFRMKVTKKVETETGAVLTLTPITQDDTLSGEIFFKVPLDTGFKTGDEFVVDKPVEEIVVEVTEP